MAILIFADGSALSGDKPIPLPALQGTTGIPSGDQSAAREDQSLIAAGQALWKAKIVKIAHHHWLVYRCATLTYFFSLLRTGARPLRRRMPRPRLRMALRLRPRLQNSVGLLGFRLGLRNLVMLFGLLVLKLRTKPRHSTLFGLQVRVATRKNRTKARQHGGRDAAVASGKLCLHWLC